MPAYCSKQGCAKLHHFNEEDGKITVKTEQQPNGEFTAIDAENYDYDSPVGWGLSRFHAIADLFEKMPRAESEREERDLLADKLEHERELRVFGW